MPLIVKVPYGAGVEDAIPVEPAPEPLEFEFKLGDGSEVKGEVRIPSVFRLLHRSDEKGVPIYVFSVQLKTELIKASVEVIAEEKA